MNKVLQKAYEDSSVRIHAQSESKPALTNSYNDEVSRYYKLLSREGYGNIFGDTIFYYRNKKFFKKWINTMT